MKNEDNMEKEVSQENNEILTMAQAIEMLKTTRSTFYRWVREGKLKGTKVGRQWRFHVKDVERFLAGEGPRIDLPVNISPLINKLEERLRETGVSELSDSDDTVQHAVNLMIILAYRSGATNIDIITHMEQGANEPQSVMRCRIDGVLHVMTDIDHRLAPAVIDRLKSMAACNINEHKLPQDGRIQLTLQPPMCDHSSQNLDLRVNFLPTALGESVTIRLLDKNSITLNLDRMNFSPADHMRLKNALDARAGMVLITGPVGCGKTTVLYACINRLAKSEVKIISLENPVEYLMPWIVQIQTRPELGLTFARTLRACLRADPDVLIVGEIQDKETLDVIFQATLTGHLVLSVLHTNDAASALIRMVDVGADPFFIETSTRMIVAQRLVRKICPHCRKPNKTEPNGLEKLKAMADEGGFKGEVEIANCMEPVGCSKCNQVGYRGRMLIAETLEVTSEISKALRDGADAAQLQKIAVQQGMTTMAADGLSRVLSGETSAEEVLRTLRQ